MRPPDVGCWIALRPPAIVAGLIAMGVLSAGCEPGAPSPTPPPPTAAQPERTPNAAPSSPTIVMTINDAEATIRRGWIPELQARIVRSAYVNMADLAAELEPDDGGMLFVGGETIVGHWDAEDYGDPIIMVEVEYPAAESLAREHFQPSRMPPSTDPESSSFCILTANEGRHTTFFSARHGMKIGHHFRTVPEALWERVVNNPIWVDPETSTSRRSPTPTQISPPPRPSRTPGTLIGSEATQVVSPGEVPSALGEVVRTLPWIPGSAWNYRSLSVDNYVDWQSSTLTERVVSASRLAADVMEVRFERSPMERSGWELPGSTYVLAYLAPSGAVVGIPESMSVETFRATVASPADPNERAGREDVWEILRLPLQVSERYNNRWQLQATEAFEGPLGKFPESYALDEVYNAGFAWRHWLEPGVGFVRHEFAGTGREGCRVEVFELVDFHVPEWAEVP